MKLTAFFAFCLTLALSIFWIGRWNPPLQQHEIVTNASGLTDSPQASQPTFAAEEKPLELGLAQALSEARHQVRELTAEEVKLPENQQVRAFAANPGQQLTARFSREGMRIGSGKSEAAWQADFRAVTGESEPQWDGSRVEYRTADLTEWVVNREEGLEQGWTLARRGAGGETGRLVVQVDGVTVPSAPMTTARSSYARGHGARSPHKQRSAPSTR